MLKTMSNPWASLEVIKALANNCGKDSAKRIRDTIIQQIRDENKDVPYSKTIVVPTKRVIEYLDLDVDYIKEMALKEQELEYMKQFGPKANAGISK